MQRDFIFANRSLAAEALHPGIGFVNGHRGRADGVRETVPQPYRKTVAVAFCQHIELRVAGAEGGQPFAAARGERADLFLPVILPEPVLPGKISLKGIHKKALPCGVPVFIRQRK